MIVERRRDRTKGKPRRFTAYQVDEVEFGKPFKLDPNWVRFVLSEEGFHTPPGWRLTLQAAAIRGTLQEVTLRHCTRSQR